MRLAFADWLQWDYRVDSVYQMPLGGSHSALCYLAEELARLGHEVFLINFTTNPGVSCGVKCLSFRESVSQEWLHSLDAMIILNTPSPGPTFRPHLAAKTRLILWTQQAHDQPTMNPLHDPQVRNAYDAIVVISDWQRQQLQSCFGIDPARTFVLRNAIGPAFHDLFPGDSAILAHKTKPPVLAYTSTPFRGLNVLLKIFPRIRAAVPGVSLKVFSSMQVYLIPKTQDEKEYGDLYRLCREMEGVEHVGSVPQPELARRLRSVSVLAYPNTFAETGCIAAMEAMAAGCWVVTSALGALPETTAGFARLVPQPLENPARYNDRFVEETVQVLQTLTRPDASAAEDHLRRQAAYVNKSVTWPVRAREWSKWLGTILS